MFEVSQNHMICLVQSLSTPTVFSSACLIFQWNCRFGSSLDFSQLWDYWGLQGHYFHFILLIPIFSEECQLSHAVVALCQSAFHLLILSHFLCTGCIQDLKSFCYFLHLLIFTNAFQELEGQSGALVTSKMQRERNQDFICAVCYRCRSICSHCVFITCGKFAPGVGPRCVPHVWVMQSRLLYTFVCMHREHAAWGALRRYTFCLV